MTKHYSFTIPQRDADIAAYLDGRDVSATVRDALRAWMGQPTLADVLAAVKNITSAPAQSLAEEPDELAAAIDALLA